MPCLFVRLTCSLSAVSSRLICVVIGFRTSLLRLDNAPLCVGNHTVLIHLSVDGRLGYLSFLPSVNNAPVSIGVQTLFSGHEFLFAFCHNGDVICESEAIDISPGNLDSNLCFIQPGILHDVFCV